MHSSNILNKPMLESKSRCLIFSCIWPDRKFFRTETACLSSAYISYQPQSQSLCGHRLHLGAVYHYLCHICIPSYSSPCIHCPLYKQDLWKQGLYSLLLVTGLYFTCLLYQVTSSTETTQALSLLEETEARGDMHNQRDQPFLPLHPWSSAEEDKGRIWHATHL